MGENLEHHITIEIIKGGFVLHYPQKSANVVGIETFNQMRELFTSSRKMNQRIKEVLDAVSTTPVESE